MIKKLNPNGNIQKLKPRTALTVGTSRQGVVETSYQLLVSIFGKPRVYNQNGRKIDCEWLIMTPEGVATIYNYKDGMNYKGAVEGTPREKITQWHIGGRHESVVDVIKNKIAMTELEQDIAKKKKELKRQAAELGIWEDFGQGEVRKLKEKYSKFDPKVSKRIREFSNWCANYTGE